MTTVTLPSRHIRIDSDASGNFFGYAFRVDGRLYTEGGFTSCKAARAAARRAVSRANRETADIRDRRRDALRCPIVSNSWGH